MREIITVNETSLSKVMKENIK